MAGPSRAGRTRTVRRVGMRCNILACRGVHLGLQTFQGVLEGRVCSQRAFLGGLGPGDQISQIGSLRAGGQLFEQFQAAPLKPLLKMRAVIPARRPPGLAECDFEGWAASRLATS